jgi:hypothetical protein
MMGFVHGTQGKVHKEGRFWIDRLLVTDELNSVINEILGHMISLLGSFGRVDRMVVIG